MKIKRHLCNAIPLMMSLLLLVACNTSPTATSPAIILQPCELGDIPAECGTFSVFENRAERSGRMIELKVAVIKARNTDPAPDPIFWLAGGPGGAATEDVAYAMQVLGLSNQRDLVFVDQRGTGGSNKVTCPRPSDPAKQVDALRACLETLENDPGAYTTAWSMDDVDDVRAALGYDQINLYGESYGATAIQVYILRHEEHVRTAALAGGSLLEVPMFEQMPRYSQQALEGLFVRCESDPACKTAYPSLRQEFAEALSRLEENPVTLPLDDPGDDQPMVLTHETLRTGLHSLLVRTDTTARVPQIIHMIHTQDWNGVASFISPLLEAGPPATTWKIMNLNILCHEEWARTISDETKAVSSISGSYLRYEDVRAITVPEEICALMPQPNEAALYGPVTTSSVPLLFINGQMDPQDPPENVADAKKFYPNSLVLIAPGQAHGYTGVSCRASIISDFIARGSVDGLLTDCLENVPLPAFAK